MHRAMSQHRVLLATTMLRNVQTVLLTSFEQTANRPGSSSFDTDIDMTSIKTGLKVAIWRRLLALAKRLRQHPHCVVDMPTGQRDKLAASEAQRCAVVDIVQGANCAIPAPRSSPPQLSNLERAANCVLSPRTTHICVAIIEGRDHVIKCMIMQ